MTGGLLFEINAHELDYMRSIMGEPVAVYARASNVLGKMEYDDQVFGLVEFAGGGHGLLHSSMSSPIGEYRVSIQCLNGNIVHSGFGGSLRYQTIRGDHGEFTTSDVSVSNPYDRELASWLDSITLGTVPMFTGADGRAAVAMAEAAYRSAESGRPILLSEL
jgi:myo-inositol 2-dehydrogenase/D-chiro-inositol 1-dehydrogenase